MVAPASFSATGGLGDSSWNLLGWLRLGWLKRP